MKKRVYLDHNATTACRDEVLSTMARVSSDVFGNPSSAHAEGRMAKDVVETAREAVAGALGARPAEIVFTGGGSEADNLAILGTVGVDNTSHVLTSKIEHPAVLNTCKHLESRGVRITYLGCTRDGVVEAEMVSSAFSEETRLVSIMHANNETGAIQPIAEIAKAAHERGITVHSDAVQSMGKMPVNVEDLGADLLSIAGHKIGGPKGIGVLYVREGTLLQAIAYGGHQESDRRPGTENIVSIAGLGIAVELAAEQQAEYSQHTDSLRRMLWNGLRERIPETTLNGCLDHSLPNTLNVSFEGVSGEDVMIALDLAGFAVSTGSACNVGAVKVSHVLEAMCLGMDRCRGSVRVSLGLSTTEADIRALLDEFPGIIERLRSGG
jgi:cysteine desulfurase